MKLKDGIRFLLVDKKQFKSNVELAKHFNTSTGSIRSTISALRREDGVAVAKLARRDAKSNRMLDAHYYVPFHSNDLSIVEDAKRGRPARIDAYSTAELPAGA